MLDPQFYLPHSDHERLRSHRFWPPSYNTGTFWGGPQLTELLRNLAELNEELDSAFAILPGLLAPEVNEDWIATQEATLAASEDLFSGKPRLLTVALSANALQRVDQVERLIESSEQWEIDGYYLVLEHPGGHYFVDNPNWMASVLDIIAALKLRGAYVLLGYCNQQMLIAGCAKVDAIASGTWMNVRTFTPEKFKTQLEDEIRQRAVWYYCPQTLSEYKIPFLDIAFRQKVLAEMAPPSSFSQSFTSQLFSGGQPSTVGLSEQDGFRHYLECLKFQAQGMVKKTFDETVTSYEGSLNDAEESIRHLGERGVRGQHRDFGEFIDVNKAALEVLKSTHGPRLRRAWKDI